MTLPPGQIRIDRFPRFGVDLAHPPPVPPPHPSLEIAGAVDRVAAIPLADLATLPRRVVVADFHCVAGWTATDLRWEGVPFAAFYREVVAPAVRPGTTITHLVLEGLDGYRNAVRLDDVLGDDVLLADGLDGAPLDGDHGAPLRLVSPGQYGYVNVKHLCRIEVHPREPRVRPHPDRRTRVTLHLVESHPRARVAHEERHRYVPGRVARPLYRQLIRPLLRRAGE